MGIQWMNVTLKREVLEVRGRDTSRKTRGVSERVTVLGRKWTGLPVFGLSCLKQEMNRDICGGIRMKWRFSK